MRRKSVGLYGGTRCVDDNSSGTQVCNCSTFYCTLLYVHSSFAIILIGERELVALLSLSSCCLVIVVWLFLAVPWMCPQFVIVVFPDHTHLLFLKQGVFILLIYQLKYIYHTIHNESMFHQLTS